MSLEIQSNHSPAGKVFFYVVKGANLIAYFSADGERIPVREALKLTYGVSHRKEMILEKDLPTDVRDKIIKYVALENLKG